MEGLGKKEKGVMDMDNSVVNVGGGGSIRELNDNGKNTIKTPSKRQKKTQNPN